MKQLIASLEKTTNKLQKKCETRDKTALSRSDKWRASQPGKNYEARTNAVAETVFSLRDSIRKIRTALEV